MDGVQMPQAVSDAPLLLRALGKIWAQFTISGSQDRVSVSRRQLSNAALRFMLYPVHVLAVPDEALLFHCLC